MQANVAQWVYNPRSDIRLESCVFQPQEKSSHKHIRGVKWQPIFNAIQGIVNTNDFRVPSVEASTGVSTVVFLPRDILPH